MPTPHYNYYPPSGAVLDQNEPRASWNGRQWIEVSKPAALNSKASLNTLAAFDRNDVWTGGEAGGRPVLMHWDGTRWQAVPLPAGVGALTGVVGPDSTHVWVTGRTPEHQPLLLRWSESRCSRHRYSRGRLL